MRYQSVDELQRVLTEEVFHYAQDSKKAAGRALGTLIEIITFYALKSWGLERGVAIERGLPEFANSEITHNVEFSLHPSTPIATVSFDRADLPITAKKMSKSVKNLPSVAALKSTQLLSKNSVLRNSCTIYEGDSFFINGYLDELHQETGRYTLATLQRQPFAIFECKRVGVEEGMKKGPQSIEKAKQGAYVARTVSALQRIRFADGRMGGVIQSADGTLRSGDYYALLNEIVQSNDKALLANFILTVGVVSNHGNWFTSDNHNKELKVLAQSYDWLLFLTDTGVATFVTDLLLRPESRYQPAKDAFLASYTGQKQGNQFTKVQISLAADAALQDYFDTHAQAIESWFNIIAPADKNLATLKSELNILSNKNWQEIHA
jgi:hypothetical protein